MDFSNLLDGFVKIDTDFSKLLHGFVKIDTRISLGCYMDLSKLIHGFLLETGHAMYQIG